MPSASHQQQEAQQARRMVIAIDSDGSETIEELAQNGLVFQSTDHMIRAMVAGDLGEKFAQTMASHACMVMAADSTNHLKRIQRTEVSNALASIRQMSAEELHALSSAAYKELCLRSQQLA
jgi:hypothetical protein